jgi:hypothetical protein
VADEGASLGFEKSEACTLDVVTMLDKVAGIEAIPALGGRDREMEL